MEQENIDLFRTTFTSKSDWQYTREAQKCKYLFQNGLHFRKKKYFWPVSSRHTSMIQFIALKILVGFRGKRSH